MTDNNNTIPLTVIATEIGADIHALTHRLGDEIFVDESTGLRVVSASTCRRLIGEKAARTQQSAPRPKPRRPTKPPTPYTCGSKPSKPARPPCVPAANGIPR